MKILLASPSPRVVPQVRECWEKFTDDHLIVKNYKEWSAYQEIRNYFLAHDEYTHLVLCPDDLVITSKDIDVLKKDIDEYDYPVISGVCTVDGDWNRPINIIIDYLPTIKRKTRSFPYIEYDELEQDITRVLFAGFPLMFIRRDIVEMIDFQSDSQMVEQTDPDLWGNLDLMFCHRCYEQDIPIYVDRRARMLHLRGNGNVINNDPTIRKILLKSGGVLQVLQRFGGNKETG